MEVMLYVSRKGLALWMFLFVKLFELVLCDAPISDDASDAGCCSTSRFPSSTPLSTTAEVSSSSSFSRPLSDVGTYKLEPANMVLLPEGTYRKGWSRPETSSTSASSEHWSTFTPDPHDEEDVLSTHTLTEFYMDAHPVSVSDYYEYLKTCGASPACSEYRPTTTLFNDSFIFVEQLSDKSLVGGDAHEQVSWWVNASNVRWNNPRGDLDGVVNGGNGTIPSAPPEDLLDHPVTHVSHFDAQHFCHWRSRYDRLALGMDGFETRLPTEVEWEYAARGGKSSRVFPWGNIELSKSGGSSRYRANYFQGTFPYGNAASDGYKFTSPRYAFPPQNAFGLYDMVGNVWEWTATPGGDGFVKKGGSFLCHFSYCFRYRNAARSFNSPDTTSSNLGFRCIHAPVDDHVAVEA